jgi:hypothetical protein
MPEVAILPNEPIEATMTDDPRDQTDADLEAADAEFDREFAALWRDPMAAGPGHLRRVMRMLNDPARRERHAGFVSLFFGGPDVGHVTYRRLLDRPAKGNLAGVYRPREWFARGR